MLLNEIQSAFVRSLTNIDSSRVRPPSHHSRQEGWTEVYGAEQDEQEDQEHWHVDEEAVRRTRDYRIEHSQFYSSHFNIPIQLTQYRTAWQEQLVMRISKIPHLVFNSPYLYTESTGSLPFLVDTGRNAMVGRRHVGGMMKTGETSPPESQNNMDNIGYSISDYGSDIITFLQMEKNIDLDKDLTSEQRITSRFYTSLIQDELNVILNALKYGDSQLWKDIYRNQCIQACLDPSGDRDLHHTSTNSGAIGNIADVYISVFSWFQIWSERVIQLNQLTSLSQSRVVSGEGGGGTTTTFNATSSNTKSLFYRGTKEVNVECAKKNAKSCYAILDLKLAQRRKEIDANNDSSSSSHHPLTLLGSTSMRPTMVDTVLFAHLADALCDVHLITILSEFKSLLHFFQSMYHTYFGVKYNVPRQRSNSSKSILPDVPTIIDDVCNKSRTQKCSWISWNDQVNGLNQFNRIPIMNDDVAMGNKSRWTHSQIGLDRQNSYKSAIEIMQSVAIHCKDLQEILINIRVQRAEENHQRTKHSVMETLQRWRMQGDLLQSSNDKASNPSKRSHSDDEGKESSNDMKKLLKKQYREQKRKDELWISGVLATVVAGLALRLAAPSEE